MFSFTDLNISRETKVKLKKNIKLKKTLFRAKMKKREKEGIIMADKSLVAYFSAQGRTRAVAEKLAELAGADLFEIKPTEEYTEADIRWTNPMARCNREKFGKRAVTIAGVVDNMDEYSTIYLGFPIWYFGAPVIVSEFLQSYDLMHKTIVLFATSGGSGFGKTADNIRKVVPPSAMVYEGIIANDVSDEELKSIIR